MPQCGAKNQKIAGEIADSALSTRRPSRNRALDMNTQNFVDIPDSNAVYVSPRHSPVSETSIKMRPKIPKAIQAEVLTKCRRRCCLCFYLKYDLDEKVGSIAHLDGHPENNSIDNLAYLCLEHHARYDSGREGGGAVDKKLMKEEVKIFRASVWDAIEKRDLVCHTFEYSSSSNTTEWLGGALRYEIVQELRRIPGIRIFDLDGRDPAILPHHSQSRLRNAPQLRAAISQRGSTISLTLRLLFPDCSRSVRSNLALKFDDLGELRRHAKSCVSQMLKIPIKGKDTRNTSSRSTNKQRAYLCFIRGRREWSTRTSVGLSRAIEYFDQAIKEDPTYADAYAAKGSCYVVLPEYTATSANHALANAREAVAKAMSWGNLAEAHACLGVIHDQYDWDSSSAELEFKDAINLDPDSVAARHWYAIYLYHRREFDLAFHQIVKACDLDPASAILKETASAIRFYQGLEHEALRDLKEAIRMDSPRAMTFSLLGRIHFQRRDVKRAEAAFKQAKRLSNRPGYGTASLGYLYARSRKKRLAQAELDELRRVEATGAPVQTSLALLYHGLGNDRKALACLHKAVEQREPELGLLRIDRRWTKLSSTREFGDLVKHIGLIYPVSPSQSPRVPC
jgi:tetratricopeptide (TPR) repeat protein